MQVGKLWFAFKFLGSFGYQHQVAWCKHHRQGCDLLSNFWVASVTNIQQIPVTLATVLWFAFKFLGSFGYQHHFCLRLRLALSCDLLSNFWVASVTNITHTGRTNATLLWFAFKFLGSFGYQHRTMFSALYGLGCDLLSNFWVASVTNIKCRQRTGTVIVVICFQIFG